MPRSSQPAPAITVAVIDTGVTGSARVPALPGGDFVDAAGDGMYDCDAHGTLTASLIGGRHHRPTASSASRPTPRLLSLRQTSDQLTSRWAPA